MKKSYLLTIGGLLAIGGVCFGANDGPRVSADSVGASVTVPEACNITSSGDNHTAEVGNGTYVSEIGTTTFTITCNDNAGFSLYAVGYTGDEIGGTNSTKLVGTTSGTTISTGTATGSNTSDPSNWAMKLGTITNPTPAYPVTITSDTNGSFASYHAVPESYTKVATRLSGTDTGTGAVGSTVTTTYAAYVDASQAADTYNGQVKYTLVHPANEIPLQPQPSTAGCINYHANASTAEGTMGCQSATDNASVMLLASNFSRAGYGFAGWSDKYDYATNSSAHFYGPQETITAPAGTTANGLSLYAVWVKSEGSFQDTSKVAALCGNNGAGGSLIAAPTDGTANLSSVSALTDQRDNQTYAIARLADGNCWMIENLRLETAGTVGQNQTDPSVTNASLSQGYGTSTTYGNFTGLATAESSNFTTTNPPIANSLYSTDGATTNTIQGGNSSYYYARMPRYNNTNTSTRASNPTGNDTSMYSYGNYYTWAAAMASVKQYDSSTSTDDEGKTSETANTSLCPTGWKLPRGGNKSREATNDFWALIVTGINEGTNPANYSSSIAPYYTGTPEGSDASNKLRAYPNNFLLSGYFGASPAGGVSSAYKMADIGYYWSSTAGSSNGSYILFLRSTVVDPGTNNNIRYGGNSIRCTVSAGT